MGRPKGRKNKVDRKEEFEETERAITEKAKKLVQWLRTSKTTLVYTGAGISTAAKIPDYRGPNGVWTLAQQGKEIIRCADIIETEPTISHMVLKELHRKKFVKHILSQNCDGLHLRSGLPQTSLSEIHGNMHIEVCTNCPQHKQFVRPFDVTKRSQFRKHGTGRNCDFCSTELVDTIVHFGEVGKVPWPLNWKGTTSLVDKADLILCLGTSLAVLKQYQFLWPEKGNNTKLVIVNLQWTPKDRMASMKVNAKCDRFLLKISELLDLDVKPYCRDCDPVLNPTRSARNEIMRKMNDCVCHIRAPRIVNREVYESIEENNGKMPGWWAAGLRTQKKEIPKSKRKPGRPRKTVKKETDTQAIRSIMNRLLDTLDPPVKRARGRPRKIVVPQREESSSEEGEEHLEVEQIQLQPQISHSASPSSLASEIGEESDDSKSDGETDPEFKITKQQLCARAAQPVWLSTRRSSATNLLELPAPKRRCRKRKCESHANNEKEETESVIEFSNGMDDMMENTKGLMMKIEVDGDAKINSENDVMDAFTS